MGLQTPPASSPGASQGQLAEPSPQSINDFDTLLRGDLQAYSDLSNALGGVVAEQVGLFTFGQKFHELTWPRPQP
jgi:hypothetical protein